MRWIHDNKANLISNTEIHKEKKSTCEFLWMNKSVNYGIIMSPAIILDDQSKFKPHQQFPYQIFDLTRKQIKDLSLKVFKCA